MNTSQVGRLDRGYLGMGNAIGHVLISVHKDFAGDHHRRLPIPHPD
jgi:hypothetical protein